MKLTAVCLALHFLTLFSLQSQKGSSLWSLIKDPYILIAAGKNSSFILLLHSEVPAVAFPISVTLNKKQLGGSKDVEEELTEMFEQIVFQWLNFCPELGKDQH
jgi:hypothetical protein